MSRYVFLSEEWLEAAEALRDHHADRIEAPDIEVRINVRIVETPFGEDVEGFVDTVGGVAIERGRHAEAHIDLTVDHATAFELFTLRDPAAMMQAFLGGKIRAEGDVAMLLALQSSPPDGETIGALSAIYAEVRSFTHGIDD